MIETNTSLEKKEKVKSSPTAPGSLPLLLCPCYSALATLPFSLLILTRELARLTMSVDSVPGGLTRTLIKDTYTRVFQRWLECCKIVFASVMNM
jgi:hypothetical protein